MEHKHNYGSIVVRMVETIPEIAQISLGIYGTVLSVNADGVDLITVDIKK